jgi:hypothetical protein
MSAGDAHEDRAAPPRAGIAAPLYVALLHHPVYDKNGAVVSTAVTNLDVHDIARLAKVYGVRRFYVVTPVLTMRRLIARILEHWETGHGAEYNRTRKEALALVRLTETLDTTLSEIESDAGRLPRVVATSARALGGTCATFADLRARLGHDPAPHLLLLGTGWGLTEEVLGRADLLLEPIRGVGDYNHLSVRAAAAVILDRLLGDR